MQLPSLFVPGIDSEGRPILSVVAKKSYTIAQGRVSCAQVQSGIVFEDLCSPDEPSMAEVLAESDVVAYKPTTDIIVTGSAWAPRGKSAYYIDCGVSVGPCSKKVRAIGPRSCGEKAFKGVVFSDPQAFESVELGYRMAYGGWAVDTKGIQFAFPPNPIGTGFVLKKKEIDFSCVKLPQLEDPENLLLPEQLVVSDYDKWTQLPQPATLGWTKRSFYPRYISANPVSGMPGSAEHSPLSFYQGASAGLYGFVLKGNEHVVLSYLDPDFPMFEFDLPGEVPVLTLDIGDGIVELKSMLQTVIVSKEKNILDMVWRGYVSLEGRGELGDLPRIVAGAQG